MATRNVQEPVEQTGAGPSNTGTVLTHPAFGMIGADRVSGKTTLNGTDFVHHNFVAITIRRSELHRDLSRDWHSGREELVQVHISEAQWATFVSSMNAGQGVACTLYRVAGEPMPEIPLRKQETVVQRELADSLRTVNEDLDAAIADVDGLLAGLSQVKRDKILARMRHAKRQVDDHLPFAARAFAKTMEATTEKAKIEVNAYMQNAIVRAGLAGLRSGEAPLELGDGSKGAAD